MPDQDRDVGPRLEDAATLTGTSRAPYPILDVRALASLGVTAPPRYTFPFWWAYTTFTRSLSRQTGLSMRDLDRGLWQFSKDSAGRHGTEPPTHR